MTTTPLLSQEFTLAQNQAKEQITVLKTERDRVKTLPMSNNARNLLFGFGLTGLVMFAGMIFLQIISGLIAIVLSVGVGLGLFFLARNIGKLDAVVRQKTELMALERQLAMARTNHITQLKTILLRKKESIKIAKTKYASLGGKVKQLKIAADNAEQDDPFRGQKLEMYQTVKAAYDGFEGNIRRAITATENFERQVGFHESMAQVSEIAKDVMTAMSDNSLDDMLSMTAFQAIETEFCDAMSQLENAIKFA